MAIEIALSREALNLIGSTRLPKEEQLVHYLEQLQVPDPYNAKLFPTLEQSVLAASDTRCASLDDVCIAQSFRSMQPPDWISPSTEDGVVGMLTKTTGDPILLDDLPTSFVKKLSKLHPSSWELYSYTVTRGTALATPYHQASYFVNQALGFQKRVFIRTLQRQGYISHRSEPKLAAEIQRRRDQFPDQKIYVLLGTDMARYMNNMYVSKIWKDAYLIQEKRFSYSGSLKPYTSAVFAAPQIRASHKYEFEYVYERVPRKWNLLIGMVHKFSLEMDPCIIDNKLIKPKSSHRFSFDI